MNGLKYAGDRYTFMAGGSNFYNSSAKIARQYPKGHVFEVYVNPANPGESVINRGLSYALLFGLIPAAFLIFGIFIIINGFPEKERELVDTQAQEHVVALKDDSPVGKAIGITLFAVIWNTIVYFIFKSDASIIYLILSGGAGIIMIGAAIHATFRIFNPRLEVEITPGNIRPGTSVVMHWRTTGRADRIGTLSIKLQCLRVTTKRGEKLKRPLFEEELLQTNSPYENAQATLQFRIPEDQPASRPGDYGGICWQLFFRGDIPLWPDLKQKLPFDVYSVDYKFEDSKLTTL